MKIAVIGAGIIGITTAYELASDGHEVTVLERRGAAAEEASFANAGLLAPGYLSTWSGLGKPSSLFRQLFQRNSSVKKRLPLSTRELAWMWQCYRARRSTPSTIDPTHLHALAAYSHGRQRCITADLKLEYEHSTGRLVLLRSEKDHKSVQSDLQFLRDAGVALRELGPAQARQVETALNPDMDFYGAIHLPDDEVGNCRQWALMLKNQMQRMGVQFLFNTCVTQLTAGDQFALGIAEDATPRRFDAVVMCAGLDSTRLLVPLGLKIPLAGLHGYTVSATIHEPLNAPHSAVVDERYKVSISRLGRRVRVAGSAEFGGSPDTHHRQALRLLYKVMFDWFPASANLSAGIQVWKSACPMLPDSAPVLGASGIPGLWLNLGHGADGWSLASGSARVLADLVGGRAPEVDVSSFKATRLQR